MKMVIIVRNDIQMGKGKMAAQVAHASVGVIMDIIESKNRDWREWMEKWLSEGQPKIVTKVNSIQELYERIERAKTLGLPSIVIRDAGRTQLEPGTVTCAAVGPGPDDLVDRVTGDLKLM